MESHPSQKSETNPDTAGNNFPVMEVASDILVIVGAVATIAGLAAMWWPLGLLAGGLGLFAMGWALAVKVARAKLKAKS